MTSSNQCRVQLSFEGNFVGVISTFDLYSLLHTKRECCSAIIQKRARV